MLVWYLQFGADGSFTNVHGDETWLRDGKVVQTVVPRPSSHDGSADAVYTYDEDASTLTVMGKGAYLALPKAVNGREPPAPRTPDSITYQVPTDLLQHVSYRRNWAGFGGV